ncbi:hypothetical protein ACFLR8_04580 [Bacteroidota bacterium]
MKSTYGPIFILLGILCCIHSALSQIPYDEAYQKEALRNAEYITMFTDRNMYAVNERIYFSSYYRKDGESAIDCWSKVLYVELVTSSGQVVANGKFRHDEKGSSGYLLIPADALTGYYYLRSYTRWMLNFGPGSYCYIPLTIINPYEQEVLTEGDESSGVEADLFRVDLPGIQCQTDKASYAPGEEVQLELSLTVSDPKLRGEYCLTVAHAGLLDTLNAHFDIDDIDRGNDFHIKYLPEIRGVSISGSVVNTEDQSPVPQTRLHFSSLGEQANYSATLTDELGRFILTLPDRTGIQELFVAAEPLADSKREIRIDQDFASEPVPFRTKQFTLSPDDKKIAIRMVLNMQLSKAYKSEEASPDSETETDSFVPFYGIPTTTVNIEEFVKLPTMNEVFVNLVPNVFVRYEEGEPYLYLEGVNRNISLFPPLVLIDQIPLFEQKDLFAIDPLKVERIEVINELYVRGDIVFGGIIIMSSKQEDMAAVDLPEESYFFDYQGFHPENSFATYYAAERIPDTRNTQLWIDKISLESEEKKTVQFPASSNPGEYHILVRGVSSRGEMVYGVSTFKVEQYEDYY